MKRAVARTHLSAKSKVTAPSREVKIPDQTKKETQATKILGFKPNARILIVRSLGGIGDVLMTTPAVRQLKQDHPDCHITYACDRRPGTNDNYYKLLKNAPFIDQIVDARHINQSGYDVVVDITSVCIAYERRNLRPKNRIDIFAEAVGVKLTDHKPFYLVTPEERAWANTVVAPIKAQGKKVVFLHTASFEGKRSWPGPKHAELVGLAKGLPIMFLVNDFNGVAKDTYDLPNTLNVSGYSVRQIAALIEASDLFIGPDSGPMHIAGALGVPSIVVFGSIPPEARINYYPSHSAVRASGFSCMPCWYRDCPYNVKCMQDIGVATVLGVMTSKVGVG